MHASEHAGCRNTIVGTTCVQRVNHACQSNFLWYTETEATLVWPYSSPICTMGTPCDSRRAAAMLRICRPRSRRTAELLVSPSSPQFQLRLWLSPSLHEHHMAEQPQHLVSCCDSCLVCRSSRLASMQAAGGRILTLPLQLTNNRWQADQDMAVLSTAYNRAYCQ